MKYILFAIAATIQLVSIAQKELKGEWDLQYRGTSEKASFDINDPTCILKIPGQSGMSVNFETKDDSLNDDLSKTSHDIFKKCWLDIVNKKKFTRNGLTIVNGVFKNEEFSGKYLVNIEKKEIEFEEIYSSGKSDKILYTYEVINDELILTSVKYPDVITKYKRRL